MTYDKLRAIILANPTEPPTAIAARVGMSVSAVGHARSYLIRIGQVAPLKPANRPITAAERETIIAMRRELRGFEEIRAHTGRGMGTLTDIIRAAINAGELPPVKRRRREERETCRGGLGDMPTPDVRLSLNMTDEEARVVASQRALLGEKAGTALEILSSFRRQQAEKRRFHGRNMHA